MRNQTITEAIDNNIFALDKVRNLVFLLHRVQETYFHNTEPTTADYEVVARSYDELMRWFGILTHHGDKAVEEMENTGTILNGVKNDR